MRKITAFNFISLNGFFEGPNGDIRWMMEHHVATGESAHTVEGLGAGNTLLFGRVTYDLMAGFWQSPIAYEQHAVTAEGMNKAEKIVFSKTLGAVDWKNTRLVKENMSVEVRRLKQLPGRDMTILGSGSIVTQLTDEGLIDEYEVLVYPIALGKGTTLFDGLRHPHTLEFISARALKSGTVLLTYRRP
ncbi:MAG TPA: dihydrofolate reductase family protein [Puia sp.]|nr:dihydrofolate reductase family protein [Puia sp.]